MKIKLLTIVLLFSTFMVFGNEKRFYVSDYGINGDGISLNTLALQKLIDKVADGGGGEIIFTKGHYLTGSIRLKSNIHLYFEKGAVMLGSTNPYDYESLEMSGRPQQGGKDDNSQMALLVAYKANNISITGMGTIDGQGRDLALNIDSLHHIGENIDPKYSVKNRRPHETMRPKLFRFSTCKNIEVKGLTDQ
ncbi:hypothetical protein GCM10028791_28470 [Echinicola sediminis]